MVAIQFVIGITPLGLPSGPITVFVYRITAVDVLVSMFLEVISTTTFALSVSLASGDLGDLMKVSHSLNVESPRTLNAFTVS
ncbi:hypothetical protein D3C75_1171130 [compost metagenome]